MNKKNNWQEFKTVLEQHHITKLYHFTDRDNLESIIRHGGLYSWADCEEKGIHISKPGGGQLSRDLDRRDHLQHFVRTSFVKEHPMKYIALQDGRISNPVVLEIDPEVIFWTDTKYADRNATKNGAKVGTSLDNFKSIHFNTVKARTHFDLDDSEQEFFQAEVMVKNHIPLQFITNIADFGIPVVNQPQQLQSRDAYTSQISRANPTAFIFLLDHSASMKRQTELLGEKMSIAEAVKRLVNRQVNELVLRCVKGTDTRHYYDIAILGYGSMVYSAWKGNLEGRDFVSPEELQNNPYQRIVTRKEIHTRKGVSVKEVEEIQWMDARCDGRQTRMDKAFSKAKELIEKWIEKHPDSYPPTIIHITDGEVVGAGQDDVIQQVNELKSMYTKDGNVLIFNIHVTPQKNIAPVSLPTSIAEVEQDKYSKFLYQASSLLPLRYNEEIARIRHDTDNQRHTAMCVNADMSLLIQMMDIGTPTTTIQNH